MPIQLNYTDPDSGNNIPVSYWIVKDAIFDYINSKVQVDIGGYVTLALKNAGKKSFLNKSYVLDFATLGVTGSSTNTQMAIAAYTWILNNDTFFTGGSIV